MLETTYNLNGELTLPVFAEAILADEPDIEQLCQTIFSFSSSFRKKSPETSISSTSSLSSEDDKCQIFLPSFIDDQGGGRGGRGGVEGSE